MLTKPPLADLVAFDDDWTPPLSAGAPPPCGLHHAWVSAVSAIPARQRCLCGGYEWRDTGALDPEGHETDAMLYLTGKAPLMGWRVHYVGH